MDNLLQNTLTGITSNAPQTAMPILPKTPKGLQVPIPVKSNKDYIKTLGAAQKQPNAIMNLQKAMQLSSRVAYNQRQKAEMEISGTQFDPTKVSGGTFAGIIGNLEARRGTDISKVYASTMQTYQVVQQEITRRLERLQEIEEEKRRWEAEQKQKEEEFEYMKEKDKKEAKRLKEEIEEDKRQFELNYKKSSGSASGYSSGYLENLHQGFKDITTGEDGKLDPGNTSQWMRDALMNAKTEKDNKAYQNFLENIRKSRKSLFSDYSIDMLEFEDKDKKSGFLDEEH